LVRTIGIALHPVQRRGSFVNHDADGVGNIVRATAGIPRLVDDVIFRIDLEESLFQSRRKIGGKNRSFGNFGKRATFNSKFI
jgi:hypothetical protein